MATITPNQPLAFGGRLDALKVNSWLYQVDSYLNPVQLSNLENQITGQIRISLTLTLINENVANWCFMLLQSVQAPGDFNGFQNSLRGDFIPQDSVRQSQDKFQPLNQIQVLLRFSMTFEIFSYLYQTLVRMKKLDKFCAGLKPQIRLEV